MIENTSLKGIIVIALWIGFVFPRPLHATEETINVNWQMQEEDFLLNARKYLDDNTEIRLSVSSINSCDGETILLGGSYREPAASYRSVLLISRDRGKTWNDAGFWLAGSAVIYIHCFDQTHAWVLTCWSVEGDQAPYDLFRTIDGGNTWHRATESLPLDIDISLSYPSEFVFRDPHNGRITFHSTVGDIATYVTIDGGVTWELSQLQKVSFDAENLRMGEDLLTQWEQEYCIERDRHSSAIVIKHLDARSNTWTTLGTISQYYQLDGIHVIPRDDF